MSLALIQQDFLRTVNSDHNGLCEHLCQGGVLEPIDRVNIYRNNTEQTRVRALSEIYPMTVGIIGTRFFNMLGHRYSGSHPATHWDLNQYGREFPQFIAEQTTGFDGLAELPYLGELGHLEWLLHQSYYAVNSTEFPLEQFSGLDSASQQACRLLLSPSVGLINTDWPLYDLWQHWQQGALPNALEALSATEYLCVSKDRHRPTITLISREQYLLLSKLSHTSLVALATQPELASALKALPEYMAKGWIADYCLLGADHV